MGCSFAVRSFFALAVSLPVTRLGQSWSDGYGGTEEHPLLKSISTGDEGESHHLAVQDLGTESSMISLMHGVYVQDCTKINSPAAGKCGTFISGWALSKKILALSKKYCCLLSSSAFFSGKKYEKHLWRSMSGTPLPLVKYSPRIHFCHDIFFICFKSFWALSMLKWKDKVFPTAVYFGKHKAAILWALSFYF